ncbi:MAG: hypothetical protein K0S32_2033 [Bacteroidetes bacterium]|jgi:hypothetical protein|nr:hypothetical protein [Bacteroidota bacterium]
MASKNRLVKQLYDAVFIDPEPMQYCETPAACEEVNVNPYMKHEGKIIRMIRIVVYDPFGYSVTDSVRKKINYFQRAGNLSHITTRRWVVNNRLLFKQNDSLDALRLSETERLLRGAPFVNDAKITVEPLLTSDDTVDVRVIVHDKWAIQVPLMITDVTSNIRLQNRNLFGLGQQFEQYVGFKRPDVFDYSGYYSIDNLDNTYISSRLAYQATITNTAVGLSFDRGFYSPLVPWAGGASANHNWNYYYYTDKEDSTSKKMDITSFGYDLWLGRAFKFSKAKTFFNQSTNIILGSRFYHNGYLKRPSFEIDTSRSIYNTSAYIGNVGFAIQQYYKDRFIHRFGANEDVPEGLIIQYIYGGIKKQYDNKIRYYSGMEVARAKHFEKIGYLSATFSYGVFFNTEVPNDITTNFNIYYFSHLKRNGKWFFRQFVYYNFVYGANKLFGETVTLSGGELYGFSPGSLSGNTKMVLNSETVAYAPYNVIGFRFAPVVMIGLGMVGGPQQNIVESNLYQGYSVGIMVRNENLVSSTFQVSVGFYPFLPDGKENVFMYNPVTSFTLRVRAFAVSRPEFVSY